MPAGPSGMSGQRRRPGRPGRNGAYKSILLRAKVLSRRRISGDTQILALENPEQFSLRLLGLGEPPRLLCRTFAKRISGARPARPSNVSRTSNVTIFQFWSAATSTTTPRATTALSAHQPFETGQLERRLQFLCEGDVGSEKAGKRQDLQASPWKFAATWKGPPDLGTNRFEAANGPMKALPHSYLL